jgi:uncharacterized protein
VVAVSLDDRTIDVKKRKDTADIHPEAVFAHSFVDTKVLADSLMRLGEYGLLTGSKAKGNIARHVTF